MSNDVEENPEPRVFDPTKAVTAELVAKGVMSTSIKVQKEFNELFDPTHTVCADFNQGNESVFG